VLLETDAGTIGENLRTNLLRFGKLETPGGLDFVTDPRSCHNYDDPGSSGGP